MVKRLKRKDIVWEKILHIKYLVKDLYPQHVKNKTTIIQQSESQHLSFF